MKLLVIILNKTECLEELLEAFTQNNISGATIIDSKGMLQELYEHDEFKFKNDIFLGIIFILWRIMINYIKLFFSC